MTRYLLDTSSLIDFTKGREPVTARILAMLERGDEIVICAVTIAELYSGFALDDIADWLPFARRLYYHDISLDAAIGAGRDRYQFARQGWAIATTDALIAAAARELGAILVTDNTRHFPMTDIRVESLRA